MWYCPRWTANLTGQYPDHPFADGDDWDDIFTEARCSSFSRSATIYVDEDDDQLEVSVDDYGEAYCGMHDRTAEWDPDYDVAADLEAAGFYTCEECDTVYHEFHALATHRAETHDDEYENDDAGDTIVRRGYERRPTVATSHSGWTTA